jgi:hypothetical protein
VAGSWVVLVTVGGLGGVFVLMMALSIYSDSRIIAQSRDQAIPDPISPDDSEGGGVNEDIKFIEASLPSIFKSNSLWTKIKEEMKVYHRWLGIVFYYSPEFPRSMRVLSLFTSIVIMLFVQSVTYNIADPDDGSCEACKDESRCLSLRSTLNVRESRCYWDSESDFHLATSSYPSSSSSSGSCHFREIEGDMTRMFIVALISAIVSAPFALGVQYLIVNVLSKATMSQEQERKARESAKALKLRRLLSTRKMSIQPDLTTSTELVESCGRSTQDDLNHLLKEISAYYKYLQKNKKAKAKEFLGMGFFSLPCSLFSPPL